MKTLKTKLILAFLSIMAISVKAQVVFTGQNHHLSQYINDLKQDNHYYHEKISYY